MPLISILCSIMCVYFILIWFILEARAEICQKFRSFFGQWSFKKNCFWDVLTFSAENKQKLAFSDPHSPYKCLRSIWMVPSRKSLLCIAGWDNSPTSTLWQIPRFDEKLSKMSMVVIKKGRLLKAFHESRSFWSLYSWHSDASISWKLTGSF